MIYFLTYPFFFVMARFAARLLGRLRSSGEENVPHRGGFIYCPNHISDADPPILFVTFPRRAWFIGKMELFQIPVVGWFFYHFHAFPIRRDTADRKALRQAEDCLKRGEPILLFPEGRCSRNGKLQRILPGAALLSLRTGTPIIPVGIENTDKVLPYSSLRPRFSKDPITVTFGKPIRPQAYSQLSRSAAINAICEQIGNDLAQMTHQDPPPPPEKPAHKHHAEAPDTDAEPTAEEVSSGR